MSTRHRIEEREVEIEVRGVRIVGDLALPPSPRGAVLFAHGSGSSRHSTRNRAVARTLNDAGLATFLLDLLTREEEVREEAGAMLRFDVVSLADRLVAAIDWLANSPATRTLPIGVFGASTGAAIALIAAAARPVSVRAVVSRGGRPDLADRTLEHVHCPTLLIVGGADPVVLDLNRRALQRMTCARELAIVPRATHLFEEPGGLHEVARLATEWFVRHLPLAKNAAKSAKRGALRDMTPFDRHDRDDLETRNDMELPDPRSPREEPRREIEPPPHEPKPSRPNEAPERTEPPFVPTPPSPRVPERPPEMPPSRPPNIGSRVRTPTTQLGSIEAATRLSPRDTLSTHA